MWKLKGRGWFNPIDVGNPSKEGKGYTKTSLNSSTHLEVSRPGKAFQLYVHEREGVLGSVNSKVGTWAPACSLFIQEAQLNYLRLASLPLKSCSYCSLDRRCFKCLFWGQTNYFYQPPSKTTPKWERPFMDGCQRILRYQVMLMENPGFTICPCEVLNPATLLPTPEGSLPFHSYLETLDHWTKTPREIVRRSSDQSWGNLVHWWKSGTALSWMEKEELDMQ